MFNKFLYSLLHYKSIITNEINNKLLQKRNKCISFNFTPQESPNHIYGHKNCTKLIKTNDSCKYKKIQK